MPEERVETLKAESIPELLRQLSIDTTTLVRKEIELAKVELSDKFEKLGGIAASAGTAALFGLGAFGAVTTMLIVLLALVTPLWAAALMVAIAYAIVAVIAVQQSRKKLAVLTPVAPKTAQTVKEDIEWAKTRTQSN